MRQRIGRLALFVAFVAGCTLSSGANLLVLARPTKRAHPVEPTTDPPPKVAPLRVAPDSTGHSADDGPESFEFMLGSLVAAHDPAQARLASSTLPSEDLAAREAAEEEEEEEEEAAQSQQQINQHARSHRNHNQHQHQNQYVQQQQRRRAHEQRQLWPLDEETQMIERILVADLSRRLHRSHQLQEEQTSDDSPTSQHYYATGARFSLEPASSSSSSATTKTPAASLSLPSSSPTTDDSMIASDQLRRRLGGGGARRLIKRSGISDQRLAEMQMIRALKKQSERAASSRLAAASNISAAGLDLVST